MPRTSSPPTFTGEVHPAAEVFPMLSPDELAELAESIKAEGLLSAIVLDPAGRLLDGRNRLAACELAGIEPTFVIYEGDPVAFVLGSNVNRRHMTTGQRAMATAVVLEAGGLRVDGRWKYGAVTGQTDESVGSAGWAVRLREAGVILDHAPDLAELVISGAMALSVAYEQASKIRTEAMSAGSKLDRLTAEHPDLAKLVTEESMELDEAWAAAEVRREKAAEALREEQRYHKEWNQAFAQALNRITEATFDAARLAKHFEHWDHLDTLTREPVTKEDIDRAIRGLQAIKKGWPE